MPDTDLIADLMGALEQCDTYHRSAEAAFGQHSRLKTDLNTVKLSLAEAIYREKGDDGKAKFSNDVLREVELQRRLIADHRLLVEQEWHAAEVYRSEANDLERSEARLRTLRGLLAYRTAEVHLEAEQLRAATVANEATADRYDSEDVASMALIDSGTPYRTKEEYAYYEELPF